MRGRPSSYRAPSARTAWSTATPLSAARKFKIRCNNQAATVVDAATNGVGTGVFGATSRVYLGARPVIGGTGINQELDAQMSHFVLGAGLQPRSVMAAVENYVIAATVTPMPGIRTLLVGDMR